MSISFDILREVFAHIKGQKNKLSFSAINKWARITFLPLIWIQTFNLKEMTDANLSFIKTANVDTVYFHRYLHEISDEYFTKLVELDKYTNPKFVCTGHDELGELYCFWSYNINNRFYHCLKCGKVSCSFICKTVNGYLLCSCNGVCTKISMDNNGLIIRKNCFL